MRRVLALLLMLMVPFQLAWAAAHISYGHPDAEAPMPAFHTHDDGQVHHDDGLADKDGHTAGSHDDGSQGGHHHPVFSYLVAGSDLQLAEAPTGGPPVHPPSSFTPHIPPLFDWPPSVPG